MADLIDPNRKEVIQKKIPYYAGILANFTRREILKQSSEAVSFLHGLNMIHRNLHPDNFLISCGDPNKGPFRIKLTDFQLSIDIRKKHDLSGTMYKDGWVAPESCNKSEIKLDDKLDAFIMGCYYFYVLSGGTHPFGKGVDTQLLRITNNNDTVYHEEWDGKPDWGTNSADQVYTLLN